MKRGGDEWHNEAGVGGSHQEEVEKKARENEGNSEANNQKTAEGSHNVGKTQ